MPAKDLGTKHTCFKCGAKFYDLKKPEPLCPKCGADQRASPALKAPAHAERRQRAPARPVEPEEVEAETELDEELEEADAEDDAADEADEP
ncbi:MAG TPA: TIGR02300 family protein [Anaeromyxobacter sp.]|nr:TIGR02300 family protein [Anaeromyxobacter sp.]